MGTVSSKKAAGRTLWIAFAVILVDALGVGILIPIIPLLFTDPSYPYHLGISATNGYLLLGGLTAIYPFMMFISLPILGQLSDTFGRKPLLVMSLLGTAVSYVLFAIGILTTSIWLLFISRFIDGITGGNAAIVQAAIADTSEEDERIHKFSFLSAANGIGFILGPVFGAVLSDPGIVHWFSAPIPFWFAAAISLLNMWFVILIFPETLRTKTKHKIKILQGLINIKDAAIGKKRRSLYMTAFLYQSGFAFIITFFGVYLVSRFGFHQREIAMLFVYVGLTFAATQLIITRPLAKRSPPEVVIPSALMLMSGSLIGIYFVHDTLALYLYALPIAMSAALIVSNLTGLISTTTKHANQGSVLGINSSVQALAQTLPPLFAGVIAAVFAPTTPMLFAALAIGVAGIFFTLTWYVSHD